ncbi:MAG: hydrogenase maturation factor [Lachnospiraceae bacterium]|nr:hydrogenase maturation factor [Lachnospiraceae bacterium]
MKVGKVSETILKRSIFKQIRTTREEVLLGAGVGEDCAAMKLAPGEIFVISTDPITGTAKDIGMLAIQITANDLASSGAEPIGVMLTALLPEYIEEANIAEIMEQVEEACSRLHIQVMGGHTEITRVVTQPVLSVTGIGKVREDRLVSTSGAKAGQDILVTKWIGIEGTSVIAKEKEEELRTRFSRTFVEKAKELDQYISVLPEAMIAGKFGVSAMHDVTEGGIYGALWEMAEASGIGLEIDLKAIPIRQETVEICEHFNLNPYYLISSGCMLMASDRGHDLVRELKKEGIPATVIGKAVEGNGRRILNGEEESFLERPRTDELYKIYD